MKKILLFLFMLCLVKFSYGEEVAEILKSIEEKVKNIDTYKADFVLKIIESPDKEMLMDGSILYKREDKLRVEVRIPNVSHATQLTVSNGETMWQYLPSFKVASRIDLGYLKKKFSDEYFAYAKEDISKPLKDAEESSIRYLGKEKIDGQECVVLEAEPKETAVRDFPFSKLKIWVDTNTGLEIKTVFYNAEGKEMLSRTYEKISVNIPISDKEFEFSPPEGVEIVEMTEEVEKFIGVESKKGTPQFSPFPSPEASLP